MDNIRLVIADDHPVVRRGLISMLSTYSGIDVIGEASDSSSTLEILDKLAPDILVLDMKMPGCDGISLIHQIKQKHPGLKIVVLTIYDNDEYVCGAVEAGVDAYILKNIAHEELVNTIRAVYKGDIMIDKPLVGKVLRKYKSIARENYKAGIGLSEDDLKILRLAAKGLKNKDIGRECHWSEITVKHKLQLIYNKFNVSDKTQAVAEAIRKGLI